MWSWTPSHIPCQNFTLPLWGYVCDHVFSYNNFCSLCINAVKWFNNNFPSEAEFVENIWWLILLLHVQNHKDNCTYLYSSAYVCGVGHFHGETAEMTWVELNQLALQTCQMNNGHRQDMIIDHHSHWNWMKMSNMGVSFEISTRLSLSSQ